MVMNPGDYPWSSYGYDAQGRKDNLVAEHPLCQQPGPDRERRRRAYRELFNDEIQEETVEAIREAANKAWALGDDRFTSRIETLLNRPAAPRARGGDRKPRLFKEQRKINRV